MDSQEQSAKKAVGMAAFTHYVQEALNHLFDHFYLQGHPLGALLARGAPPEARGRTVSKVLVQAIEELKPSADVPEQSLAWRKYKHLRLRYIEAREPEQVAAQFALSDRQARRDHHQALGSLVALLWARYCALNQPDTAPAPEEAPGRPQPAESTGLGLEEEAERVAKGSPPAPSDPAEVLNSVLATTLPLLSSRGLRVDSSLPHDLPLVAVSQPLLRQILIGLVTYVAEHASPPSLRLETQSEASSIRLTLSYRSEPAAPENELLDAAQRLAESQGCSLSCSHGPEGSRLSLTLPAASRPTVLVIDDNPDVSLLFRRYLGEAYRVISATNWEEAIRLAASEGPAVITLDVMMPGVDGWDLLSRLRSEPATSEVPVVVCSVMPEPALAFALGADAFLAKPFTATSLRSTLDRSRSRQPSPRPG